MAGRTWDDSRTAITSNPNRVTRERLGELIKALRHELSGFQLGKAVVEPVFGVVDVRLFGVRFKCVENALQDDDSYRLVHIIKLEDIKSDDIFLVLAEAGYLRWLREQISTHVFFRMLNYRNRWELLVAAALARVIEQKKGDYLRKIIEEIRDKPLMQIYHRDPTVFDWILR